MPAFRRKVDISLLFLFCSETGKRETLEDQLLELVTYVLPLSRSLSEAEGWGFAGLEDYVPWIVRN